jgi:hypothetical protein
MPNLRRSTDRADAVREECLCRRACPNCSHDGRWHNHADEVCALHPDTLVDAPAPGG